MSEILFTHRPAAGVSVAATSENGVLYVAFALTNDGTSRKQYFYPERRDTFSRAKARSILTGRLASMIQTGQPVNLGLMFATELSSRKFIESFRRVFKPTEDESDLFLNDDVLMPEETGCDHVIRFRLPPAKILAKLTELSFEITTETVNA